MTTPESLIREWEERAKTVQPLEVAVTLRRCAQQLREALVAEHVRLADGRCACQVFHEPVPGTNLDKRIGARQPVPPLPHPEHPKGEGDE